MRQPILLTRYLLGSLMGAVLFKSCSIAAQSAPTEPDDFVFANFGPLPFTTSTAEVPLPPGSPLGNTLPATLTVPQTPPLPAPEATPTATPTFPPTPQPPYPVVFFYSGFQSQASWYKPIVDRLASWGNIVVQYDTAFLSLPTIASELEAFPSLLEWVKQQSTTPGSPLNGSTNPDNLVVAGHSRGGKLATLVFANNPEQVKAAWLIDPVDTSPYAPESADNPSATKALRESGRPAGFSGAGILSNCNPTEGGFPQYQVMFTAAGAGSWEVALPGASHSSFSDAGAIFNVAQDALCGAGKISREETAKLTAAPMLTWFHTHQLNNYIESNTANDAMLREFQAWVQREETAGLLDFKEKKPDASPAPPGEATLAPEVFFAKLG